jgi:hypothetical protein
MISHIGHHILMKCGYVHKTASSITMWCLNPITASCWHHHDVHHHTARLHRRPLTLSLLTTTVAHHHTTSNHFIWSNWSLYHANQFITVRQSRHCGISTYVSTLCQQCIHSCQSYVTTPHRSQHLVTLSIPLQSCQKTESNQVQCTPLPTNSQHMLWSATPSISSC